LNPAEFFYRIPGRAVGARPGFHPARNTGDGQAFRHLAPFLAHPDPRRLDLRASLTDPFDTFRVRLYEQRSAIPVHAVLDVSGSLRFQGRHPKMSVLADFLESLAVSVDRTGDTLGVVAAAERVYPEYGLPPTRRPGAAFGLAARLRRFRPEGTGCRGLERAVRLLPGRPGLVFLVSDFHLPLPAIRGLLAALSRHHLVPLVLWDEAEAEPGGHGLARLSDLEGGGERLLLLRPALRQRFADNFRQRRGQLLALFRQSGREPVFLERGFDAQRLSRHFLERA
jgi:hypothetical protein